MLEVHLSILLIDDKVPDTPRTVVLSEKGGSIGRSPTCSLSLDDKIRYISRRQCLIEVNNELVSLTNEGVNPCWVNKQMVPQRQKVVIATGDIIAICNYKIGVLLKNNNSMFPPESKWSPLNISADHASAQLVATTSSKFDYVPTTGQPNRSELPTQRSLLDDNDKLDRDDPLGLNLYRNIKADHFKNIFRGSDSDHLSPEKQAFLPKGNVPDIERRSNQVAITIERRNHYYNIGDDIAINQVHGTEEPMPIATTTTTPGFPATQETQPRSSASANTSRNLIPDGYDVASDTFNQRS